MKTTDFLYEQQGCFEEIMYESFYDGINEIKKLENLTTLFLDYTEGMAEEHELMTMQTPYGEAGEKYIKLSKYITRANTIQAEIAKTLRHPEADKIIFVFILSFYSNWVNILNCILLLNNLY